MNLARLKYLADQIQVELAGAKKSGESPPATVFPHLFDGHLFASQAELDTYNAAVAVRNANLAQWESAEAANYRGPISAASLTLYDWAFFFQRGLDRIAYNVFSAKPVYQDNATGRTFHPGDLANLQGVDVSAYAANGGVLAQFV